jgi:hypothetical protein
MANSIALANKFMPVLDEIFKRESLTAIMDAQTKPINFLGANEVKVYKTSVVGMGTYSRANGYPTGDVTGTWETLTLASSRGRAFSLDRMDDEETLGMAFGTLATEFIRVSVAPEVDAYRFSKYASWSGISSPTAAALSTAAEVIAALRVATSTMDENEVPDGRALFITPTLLGLVEDQDTTKSKEVLSRFSSIVKVPQTRFYKGITLDAGASSSAGGYSKTATTGRNINFLAVHPSAVLQATKLAQLKIFSPDDNQSSDGYLAQYRLYHDAFVYENKVSGVYAHVKDS